MAAVRDAAAETFSQVESHESARCRCSKIVPAVIFRPRLPSSSFSRDGSVGR